MEWMARIHNLGLESGSQQIDDWFVNVKYDWDALIKRLVHVAPEIADSMNAHRADLGRLTDFVNNTRQAGAVWCHTDLGADNLIWGEDEPQLIDWENAGPLVPHQELGSFLRSLRSRERSTTAYRAYRRAGGPAEITEPSHLASSVSVHLNYLGCQSELLLDAAHPEQHEIAREQASNAARNLPTADELKDMIDCLNGTK